MEINPDLTPDLTILSIHHKKGAVSLILVVNRRLWTCESLNCHVKMIYSAGENELELTEGLHDRNRELTRGSVTS